MPAPVVTLLTDYGLADEFVGVCHGVIARGCPDAHVLDLTHGIAAQDVRAGAVVLARSIPFLPVGIHVAVVDPGVGGARRAVAIACADGRTLVGPDNGLLWPAVQAAGGALAAVDIGDSPVALRPISATFHGRDVFAAVAAALAAGARLTVLGAPVDPASLTRLQLPVARLVDGELIADVIAVDHFGNLELGARAEDLVALGIELGATVIARAAGADHVAACRRTFGDVPAGELLLYEDPQATLSLAVNRGSAADALGVGAGAQLRIAASS